MIAVRAALDNKTITEVKNMFEEDPELAERLYNAVLEFNKPHLGKKLAVEKKKDDAKKSNEKDKEKKD
jgi:dsDNA-specific endonuclease/ATPase MutS2